MQETKTKKQIIFEAAAKLFRDKGYSATSMRDLAKAVGLKASSLYNHIGSKEEILKDICFSTARRFLSAMDEIEQQDISSKEKVKLLIQLHIALAIEDMSSVTSFNDEWRHLSEPFLSDFSTLRKDYESRFKNILKKGIKEGSFKDIHPSVALYTILSSVRWLYDWFKPNRNISIDKVTEDIIQLLINGLEQ